MHHSIVEVKEISKNYQIGSREPYLVLRDALAHLYKAPFRVFKFDSGTPSKRIFSALNKVDFKVQPGEVIGIIGRNGAGKTTLLKILSRITYPSSGEIILRGRVASLLEVGTGFHPELTGRENIFFNGAILGMKKREILAKFNEIVEFAEIERFIDTPVKHYSSGMQLRLAFSVAAHLEPEILLIDEVLAVGDVQFQKKCLGKMDEVAKEGRTVLFVSHNMEAVERLCARAILLKDGTIVKDGPVAEVIQDYLQVGMEENGERLWTDLKSAPGDSVVRLRAVRVRDARGNISNNFNVRDPVVVELEYQILEEGHPITAVLGLMTNRHQSILYSFDNVDSPWTGDKVRPKGVYRSACQIPGDFLNNGQVVVDAMVVTHPLPLRASAPDAVRFNVVDDMDQRGVRGNMPREWPAAAVRPRLSWNVERV